MKPKPKRKRKVLDFLFDMAAIRIERIRCVWCQRRDPNCGLCNGHGYLWRKAAKK